MVKIVKKRSITRSIREHRHAEKVGTFAFFLGIVLSVIAGLPGEVPAATATMAPLLLTLFGLVVGYLNINDEDIKTFLIATVALLLAAKGGISTLPSVGIYIQSMLYYVSLFVSSAAIIVSLKAIHDIAKSRT